MGMTCEEGDWSSQLASGWIAGGALAPAEAGWQALPQEQLIKELLGPCGAAMNTEEQKKAILPYLQVLQISQQAPCPMCRAPNTLH